MSHTIVTRPSIGFPHLDPSSSEPYAFVGLSERLDPEEVTTIGDCVMAVFGTEEFCRGQRLTVPLGLHAEALARRAA